VALVQHAGRRNKQRDRTAKTLPIINRALELDPLSVALFHELGRVLTFRGRFVEMDARLAAYPLNQVVPGTRGRALRGCPGRGTAAASGAHDGRISGPPPGR
jgi:hypothetical protein